MQCIVTTKMSKIWIISILLIINLNITAQVGIGNEDPKTMLDVDGAISFRKDGILNLHNGQNDDIILGDLYSFYIIEGPTDDFSITGFDKGTAGADGHVIFLQNTTPHKMKFMYLNEDSLPENRLFISNNQDIVIPAQYATFSIQYSDRIDKWWLTGAMDLVDDLEYTTPVGEGLAPGQSRTYTVPVPGIATPLPPARRISAFTVNIAGPTTGNEVNDLTIEYKESRDKQMLFKVKNNSATFTYDFTKYRILIFR